MRDEAETGGEIVVERDLMAPMRDGVRLATDIYRPAFAPLPLPALLERTPYGKDGVNHADCTRADPTPVPRSMIAEQFARAGYIVAVQDCRGRYGSEGDFSKYVNEAEDGYDTIRWLADQPGCNGSVGTFGLSYGAHTQSALAGLNPPALKAMFLDSGGFSSAYHSGIRQGGAFELKQATWAYKHALLSPETARDPARKAALEAEDIGAWFHRLPWSEGGSPLHAAPEYEAYLFQQWRSGLFGPYWRQPGLYGRGFYASFADVPMVHMASWYDPYARTACENFLGLSRLKRGPVKLVLGPWTHGRRSVSYAGDVDFGPEAPLDGPLAADYVALRLAWFDHWLKGLGCDPLPTVKLFVMGGGSGRRTEEGRLDHGGTWRDERDWPPPGAVATPLYLHADGALRAAAPDDDEACREYLHDPASPVPTIGGAIASGAPVMEAGAFDQREGERFFGSAVIGRPLADRPDVVVFRSEPLSEDIEAVGPVEADLWIASSAPDTDFTVKLIDEHPPSADYPEGFALNLCHGILRARYRLSWEEETLLEPGQVYRIRVEAFPTANRFLKGHRIRLDLASSNFPHFDVNPNSGEPEGFSRSPQAARNRVYMDRTRPSRLILHLLGGR